MASFGCPTGWEQWEQGTDKRNSLGSSVQVHPYFWRQLELPSVPALSHVPLFLSVLLWILHFQASVIINRVEGRRREAPRYPFSVFGGGYHHLQGSSSFQKSPPASVFIQKFKTMGYDHTSYSFVLQPASGGCFGFAKLWRASQCSR